jgi:hypothetical protein
MHNEKLGSVCPSSNVIGIFESRGWGGLAFHVKIRICTYFEAEGMKTIGMTL